MVTCQDRVTWLMTWRYLDKDKIALRCDWPVGLP